MSAELWLPGAEVELWLTTSGGASMGPAGCRVVESTARLSIDSSAAH